MRYAVALLAVAALAGCGAQQRGELGAGCADQASITRALGSAPGAVRLPGGTTLSGCLGAGISDADLQTVGLAYHSVAEALRVRARGGDDGAAMQLGYLVGATTRGAARTNGVVTELGRRVQLVGGRFVDEASPSAQTALERGLRAGTARG